MKMKTFNVYVNVNEKLRSKQKLVLMLGTFSRETLQSLNISQSDGGYL